MKQYNGYKSEMMKAYEQLPVGGYVCVIKHAEEKMYSWGSRLEISVDVAEGEYKGFFAKAFKDNTREDKKWGAVYRVTVPSDDGSEKDEWSKRTFNNFVGCVEDANTGYKWDWNEKSLVNKKVALVFRNEEWEYEGKTGWKVKPFKCISVGDCKDGKWGKYDDKPLSNNGSAPVPTMPDLSGDDGDLPWID